MPADLQQQLHAAAQQGNVTRLRQLLAKGLHPNGRRSGQNGFRPLHAATAEGHTACVAALLRAGASVRLPDKHGRMAIHVAASKGQKGPLPLLVAADQQAALARRKGASGSGSGRTALECALHHNHYNTARLLIAETPWQPASEVLAALDAILARLPRSMRQARERAMHRMYVALVASRPLTAEQWACVPLNCGGINAALRAVLARSAAEARWLVRCLPKFQRKRLRTTLLCLARLQRQGRLPPLPAQITECLSIMSIA